MNHKKFLFTGTSLLLFVVAGLSGAVNAEDFRLDSASKGQTAQTVQSGANAVTDVNSTAVQGSLTDTLVKKLSISNTYNPPYNADCSIFPVSAPLFALT